MLKRPIFFAGIVLALMQTGCGESPSTTEPVANLIKASYKPSDKAETGDYKIGVGDEVELKFFYTPELNDRLTVRPDGRISIMFAQDVMAAGRTAEQLADKIRRKLSTHLKQPDLVVIVRSFGSQKVFVSGEVTRPGPVTLSGHETLMQVLGEAGWITPVGNHDVALLVRRDAKGKEGIYSIDLKKIMDGEDMAQNVTVLPGDTVLVPPSGITSVDRWVDQNIRQLIPIPISTGYVLNNR